LRGSTKTLKKIFPKMNENFWRLTTNLKRYVDRNGRIYYRASVLKKTTEKDDENISLSNAARRGNVVDELTRKFFSWAINKNEFRKYGMEAVAKENKKGGSKIVMQPQFFDQLYDILDQYAAEFEKRNWTVYANIPSVGAQLYAGNNYYAGTVDLLVYDHNEGEYVIVDLKTTSRDRSGYYNSTKDPYGYKRGDRIQLSTYRELLKKAWGIEVGKMYIMPLTSTSLDKNNSLYDNIKTDPNGLLLEVDNTKSIYELYKFKVPKGKNTGKFNTSNYTGELVVEEDMPPDADNKKWDATALANILGDALQQIAGGQKSEATPTEEKVQDNPDQKVTPATAQKVIARFTENNDGSEFAFNGKNYMIAGDVGYIVETDTNRSITDIVTDPVQAQKIIQAWNSQDMVKSLIGMLGINEEGFMTKFTSTFKSNTKSLKNKVAKAVTAAPTKKTGIDLSSVKDEELDKINLALSELLTRNNQKAFVDLMKKNVNKSLREKVEAFANFLIDRKVSAEEVRKKCGI